LKSLKDRFAATGRRFEVEGRAGSAKLRFTKPPKPRFAPQAYDSPPSRRVYELRGKGDDAPLMAWPLVKAHQLVVSARDAAVARLKEAMPESEGPIEKRLVGRKANGDDEAPKSARVRILPLPSIGHHYADRGIRRVLVQVPAGCLLRSDDVFGSFSGLELPDATLIPSDDESMLWHYRIGKGDASVWRTVTPAALPEPVKRRRIDPLRRPSEFKGGSERRSEQARAAEAVLQALRHAEIDARPSEIRLQREPFEANGDRVEAFAAGTRFAKERLWHVEITLREPISGPLAAGDGRFLGLGIMAPPTQGGTSG
jgi:CRISPR-associated protein Csb2